MSSDNFIVAEAQLAIEKARKEKAERIKLLGDPIQLSGKPLAIEILGGIAWIAENTSVVRKLDLETGKTFQLFKGHTGPVSCLAFCDRKFGSGDKEILITGSWDNSIKLWDTASKQLISSTNAHADFVKCLFVFPSLQLLASGSSDKSVRFWNLCNLEESAPLTSAGSISAHSRPIECIDGVALSSDSALLYTADTMGVIKEWKLQKDAAMPCKWTSVLTDTLGHHRTRINEIKYGNGHLWTASADETIRMISRKQLDSNIDSFPPLSITHPTAVHAFLPLDLALGEPYLLTAAGDILRSYDISELDSPSLVVEIDAHWHDITAIKLWMRSSLEKNNTTHIEPWIITTGLDGTVRKWELRDLLNPSFSLKIQEEIVSKTTSVNPGLTEEEERELAELMDET